MSYPTGNNKREQNFLDSLRGLHFSLEDWERFLYTYRTLGGGHARKQVEAEQRLWAINRRLKEAEANG